MAVGGTNSVVTNLWRSALGRVPTGALARNVAMMGGGALAAQFMTLVGWVVLTRLYTPAAFAVLGVFFSLMNPIMGVCCFRYEQALILSRNERQAAAIAATSTSILLAISLSVATLTWVFDWHISMALGCPGLEQHLWLLAPAIFVGGLYLLLCAWAAERRQFGLMAKTRFATSATRVSSQAAIGLTMASAAGLIVGELLALGVGLLWLLARLRVSLTALLSLRWDYVTQVALRHRRFPLLATPAVFFTHLSNVLPWMFMPLLFGATQAGFMFVAHRLVNAPVQLLCSALGNVFFSQFRDGKDGGTNLQTYQKATYRLALLGAAAGACVLTAPVWAEALLGAGWRDVGWVLAALAPMVFSRFTMAPLFQILFVYDLQWVLLVVDLGRLLVTIVALVTAGMADLTLVQTVLLYSGGLFAVDLAQWLVTVWCVRRAEVSLAT